MSGSALPASSTPTRRLSTSVAASSNVQSVLPAGASCASTKMNSASIAAKPPSMTANVPRWSSGRCTRSSKIGPTRRSSPSLSTHASGILPTFQPAIAEGHIAIAAFWQA